MEWVDLAVSVAKDSEVVPTFEEYWAAPAARGEEAGYLAAGVCLRVPHRHCWWQQRVWTVPASQADCIPRDRHSLVPRMHKLVL